MIIQYSLSLSYSLTPWGFPTFQALPRKDDLMPLTDPNFICKTLSEMPREASQDGAGTGWRGLGNVVRVATLQS